MIMMMMSNEREREREIYKKKSPFIIYYERRFFITTMTKMQIMFSHFQRNQSKTNRNWGKKLQLYEA